MIPKVIATDIADKKLKTLREGRWDAAFAKSEETMAPFAFDDLSRAEANRRATVIYEYIIQAADIAHTMQHWSTYQKFNKRLFEERYLAWINGHVANDPSVGWHKGEFGFFDFVCSLCLNGIFSHVFCLLQYIIPTAKKLKVSCAGSLLVCSFLTECNFKKEMWSVWTIVRRICDLRDR